VLSLRNREQPSPEEDFGPNPGCLFASNTSSRYIQPFAESCMKIDLLAIGAHPDDIELTCAGTILGLTKAGRTVGILDLTQGELGTRGSPGVRADEAKMAAEIMGVSVRENLDLPDGNISATVENRLRLMRVIRRLRPDTLLFPYHTDRHPDHSHAHCLCKEAWYYSGLTKIETQDDGKSQPPHRPSRYFNYMQWFEFKPSFIVDITAEWTERVAAIRAYKSQFYDPQSREPQTMLSTPEFLEFIETRAEYYGDQIGVRYGEPFFAEKVPGVRDLLTIL
jgi:bacillithiol biosynthesis deacetylase BshB1